MTRPRRKVIRVIEKRVWEQGKLVPAEQQITETYGGLDACPECATLAEDEYRLIKGGPA